jgi:dihydrofolate reductase
VPGAITAHSLEEAIELCANDDEIFVIGGAEIYRAALPLADRLLITQIDREIPGDAIFPPVDWSRWQEVERQPCVDVDRQGLRADFVVYARIQSAD